MRENSNDFGGEAHTVVQIGTVHGSVELTGTRSGPMPRQLPIPINGFVNRVEHLKELDGLLKKDKRTVVVSALSGAPGVGKTALAVTWAHQVRDEFPDGDLYVDFGGYGPGARVTSGQVLDHFLRALDVPGERIPESLSERSSLFRSMTNGRRMLIVLDNVSDPGMVRPLLPASTGCLALITSRSTLAGLVSREGAVRVTLDVLDPADAVELLRRVIGADRVDAERQAAARVAELCGHLPLALRVVAERAVGRSGLPLCDLVTELEEEQHRLDSLASGGDELSDVRAAFSWSYQAISTDMQRAFRLLGLHPGRIFSTESAMALLGGSDRRAAKRTLDELSSTHLLQEVANNRYRLHDLLRSYARELLGEEDAPKDRAKSVRRILNWYLLASDAGRRKILPHSHEVPLAAADHTAVPEFPDAEAAVAWFEEERLNILAALEQAMDTGQYDIAWKIPVVADGFFELHSSWTEWARIHHIGVEAAQVIGDRLGEASNAFALGDADWRGGRREQAMANYERVVSYAEETGDAWLTGFSLRGLGLLHLELGDRERARDCFRASLEVFRAGGVRRGEGMALLSLGEHARLAGDLDRAVALGREAVGIFGDIGDAWSGAWGALPLAEALSGTERYSEAADLLIRASQTFDRFKDRRSLAMSSSALGDLHHRTGGTETAREHWLRAADLYDSLGETGLGEELRARAGEGA